LTSEKNILIELLKDNELNKRFPLIFITNEQHNKLVSDIKKVCPEYRFRYLQSSEITSKEVTNYIQNICDKEKIEIQDAKIINNIIKFSQFDIRRLLLILQDLKLTYNNRIVGNEEWKNYIISTQKKDKDIGLYDATKLILNKYYNIDTCLQLYDVEKVLLPLMIFENYPKNALTRNVESNQELLKIMRDVTFSIASGDVIETNIYTDQNWYLQNLHGFYTCVETSFILNQYPKKYEDNNQKIDFSTDLNKTSLRNINKKNISSIQTMLPNKNLIDLLYLNRYIHYNLSKNNYNVVKELSIDYNLPPKVIKNIFKIDKTLDKINSNSKNVKFFLK
jgi:hypothetical protein